MKGKIICAVCKKVFDRTSPNQKYCCKSCKKEAEKTKKRSPFPKNKPKYSIDDVLCACDVFGKVSQKTISYGMMSHLIESGDVKYLEAVV